MCHVGPPAVGNMLPVPRDDSGPQKKKKEGVEESTELQRSFFTPPTTGGEKFARLGRQSILASWVSFGPRPLESVLFGSTSPFWLPSSSAAALAVASSSFINRHIYLIIFGGSSLQTWDRFMPRRRNLLANHATLFILTRSGGSHQSTASGNYVNFPPILSDPIRSKPKRSDPIRRMPGGAIL